jgi:hypothetical protein
MENAGVVKKEEDGKVAITGTTLNQSDAKVDKVPAVPDKHEDDHEDDDDFEEDEDKQDDAEDIEEEEDEDSEVQAKSSVPASEVKKTHWSKG